MFQKNQETKFVYNREKKYFPSQIRKIGSPEADWNSILFSIQAHIL